jgi:beta-fructofuranosidase
VTARRVGDAGAGGWLPSAADLEWRPQPGADQELRISGAGEVLTLTSSDTGVAVERGSDRWTIPDATGDMRIVVDGPVVEIFTDTGVLALPMPVRGAKRNVAAEGDLRVWELATSPTE